MTHPVGFAEEGGGVEASPRTGYEPDAAATCGSKETEMALLKGMQPLFDFFKTKNMGEEVTTDDLLAATDWKPATLRTYINKNKLSRFMTKVGEGRYRVLRNGSTLKEDDIAGALTQVTPEHLTLTRTQVLTGKRSAYTLFRERGRGATAHV